MIVGDSNEEVASKAVKHVWKVHAINTEEMTSDMKNKISHHSYRIKDNILLK